jgi:iron(III) transport system ATP-binding protein
MNPTLKLQSIAFAYAQRAVLHDISLTVKRGEIACLLGPSGCGKSTLLRLIAGFEQPTAGQLEINNQCVFNAQQNTPPQNRHVGMLFQDLALFPHLTVAENIAFGIQNQSKKHQTQRTNDLLQLCRLAAFKQRYPHQLSGGQRQRVALARAMAPKPQLILLDEPFSSVETGLQSELVHEVKTMLQADNSTALWVTHSLDEAFAVADQIGVMLEGQLLQWADPAELYQNPAHPDVVRFLNHANLITGQLVDDGLLNTAVGLIRLSNSSQFTAGQQVQVAVAKDQLIQQADLGSNAVITGCVYQGGYYIISSTLADGSSIKHHSVVAMPTGLAISLHYQSDQPHFGFAVG